MAHQRLHQPIGARLSSREKFHQIRSHNLNLVVQEAFLNDERDTSEFSTKARQQRRNLRCFSHFAFSILFAIVGVLTLGSPARGNGNLPLANITSPTEGSTVKGVVPVYVSATDNVGVVRVDLAVNGVVVASSTTAP